MNRRSFFLWKKIGVYALLYLVTGAIIASLFLYAPYGRNIFPLLRFFIICFATILLTKYFVYMVVSPWYAVVMKFKARRLRAHARTPYSPRVSVIVPAWNEEVGLVSTVQTILKSTYTNLEIVVVNDGSTDHSDEAMKAFIAEYKKLPRVRRPIEVTYRYKPNGGKGKALNYGIAVSSGDIIVSIDADCALMPDTIRNFVQHFEDPSVMAAVGNVKIGNQDHILGTLQYLEFLFSFYFKKADSLFNTIYIIGGAAGAFRREVFDSIGLYDDTNITEDIDLSVRIQNAGMKIVYAAEAVVYTEGASTFKGLSEQRLRWKRGRFQTFSTHRHLFFSTKRRHNKLLTWLILPLAVFGDTQLFFEILFLAFLYVFSFLTHDFSSFISGIFVVSSMFLVQIAEDKSAHKTLLYLLAPIGWLLFYVSTIVEYRALLTSVWGMVARQKLVWQKWERTGLNSAKLVAEAKARQ